MTRHILVPLDGSPFGESVLPLARSLASAPGTTIHLLHVQELPVVTGPLAGYAVEAPRMAEAVERMEAYLDRVAAELAPIATRTCVKTGDVGPVVAAYAGTENIDFVAVATHGRGGFSRAWLGSGTESIIVHAPVPVLVHHPAVDDEAAPAVSSPARVLVAVDRSEFSLRVLPAAEHLARALNATVDLVTVVEPIVIHARVIGRPPLDLDEAGTVQRRVKAEAFLAEVAGPLEDRGVPVRKTVLTDEQPARAIMAEAERIEAAAIAMMTHGRRAVTRVLFGSVTDKVVRGSRRDVLVVRGEPRREPDQ